MVTYASFWGRRWQSDPTLRSRATVLADGFIQASFYTDTGWDDGSVTTSLSAETVIKILQRLVDRGLENGRKSGIPEDQVVDVVHDWRNEQRGR